MFVFITNVYELRCYDVYAVTTVYDFSSITLSQPWGLICSCLLVVLNWLLFFFNLRTENSFFYIFDKSLATILRGAFHHIVKGRFPESSFFPLRHN